MSTGSRNVDEVKAFLQTSAGFNSEETVRFYDTWASTYDQMAELGFKHFVGVDGSQGMLDQASRLDLYQELKLALLGTEPLPAETGEFDVVILAGSLGEGFVPVSVVRELCNAAKTGGWVCISRGAHSNQSSTFIKDLDNELKLIEEEQQWRLEAIKHTDKYMEDPYVDLKQTPEKEEDKFIKGVAYLFRKC